VAERNGLKPYGSDPASGVPPAPDHGLKPHGLRRGSNGQVVKCAGGLVEHQAARAADLAEVQGRQLATIVGDRAGIRGFEIRARAA